LIEAPKTRRELRELERKGLISPPVPVAAPDAPVRIPAVIENHDGFMTRRQMRQLERAGQLPAAPVAEEPLFVETYRAPLTESSDSEQDGLFEVSPNLVADTHTNSIIIEQVPDITNLSHILETGEILTTGAIELPILSVNTGELAVVQDAETVDEAMAAEASSGFNPSISPVRASGVANFGAELGIVPKKMRLGEGQLYLALTVSVGLVAVGALILAAYMLKLV
jgi:hypothetical protein